MIDTNKCLGKHFYFSSEVIPNVVGPRLPNLHDNM